MSRNLFSILVVSGVCIFLQIEARADISATTKMKCGSGEYKQIAGSSLGASKLEAFVDGFQAAANLTSLIGGAVSGDVFAAIQGASGVYQEVGQLLTAVGDKATSEFVRKRIDLGQCSNMKLKFEVTSDDDPLGYLRAGIPTVNGFSKSPDPDFSQGDNGNIKRVSSEVTVTSMAVGRYVVVFTTKETDCRTCLSITHAIALDIYASPQSPQFLPLDPASQRKYIQLTNEVQRIESDLETKSRIRKNLFSRGPRTITGNLRAALENCNRHTSGRQADLCVDDAYQRNPGLCPTIYTGSSDQGFCNQLSLLEAQIKFLQEQINQKDNQVVALLAIRQRQPN